MSREQPLSAWTVSACLPPPSCPPPLSSQFILPSCLLTSLPLLVEKSTLHMQPPGMVLMGEGVEAQIRHTAWPGWEEWLGRAGSLSPNFALAGLWVPFPGLPAQLPLCLHPGAVLTCFPQRQPAKLPSGRTTTLPGLADTAPGQGSWVDMP